MGPADPLTNQSMHATFGCYYRIFQKVLKRDCPILGRTRSLATGFAFPTVSPYEVYLLIQKDPAAVAQVFKESSPGTFHWSMRLLKQNALIHGNLTSQSICLLRSKFRVSVGRKKKVKKNRSYMLKFVTKSICR